MLRASIPGARLVGASIYEREGRAAKLSKLIDATDAHSRERGLDPRRDAVQILDELTGADFAKIVKRAGVKTPSTTTVEEFMGALKHRADMREIAS